MRKLSLPEWAALAEIAGTVAVVVSLLMVAHNLDRNNSMVSAQISDNTYDALREAELFRLGSTDLLAITSNLPVAWNDLTRNEQELYRSWVYLYLDEWDRLFSRQDDGLILSENLDDWHVYFNVWAEKHVTPDVWEVIRWRYQTGRVGQIMANRLAE